MSQRFEEIRVLASSDPTPGFGWEARALDGDRVLWVRDLMPGLMIQPGAGKVTAPDAQAIADASAYLDARKPVEG